MEVIGVGWIDVGVYVFLMVVYFDYEGEFLDVDKVVEKLNCFLLQDILVYKVCWVKLDVYVRFDVIVCIYKYYIIIVKFLFNC